LLFWKGCICCIHAIKRKGEIMSGHMHAMVGDVNYLSCLFFFFFASLMRRSV
jgi:hypothetical protein